MNTFLRNLAPCKCIVCPISKPVTSYHVNLACSPECGPCATREQASTIHQVPTTVNDRRKTLFVILYPLAYRLFHSCSLFSLRVSDQCLHHQLLSSCPQVLKATPPAPRYQHGPHPAIPPFPRIAQRAPPQDLGARTLYAASGVHLLPEVSLPPSHSRDPTRYPVVQLNESRTSAPPRQPRVPGRSPRLLQRVLQNPDIANIHLLPVRHNPSLRPYPHQCSRGRATSHPAHGLRRPGPGILRVLQHGLLEGYERAGKS